MQNNRNRRVQYFIAFSLASVATTFGATSGWLPVVMPKFADNQTTIKVTETDISWLVSLTPLGYVVGSFFMQMISDRFGRRIAVLNSVLPFIVGMIIILIASRAWFLYIVRFLWGVGGGMTNNLSGVYLSEIADKEIRGSLIMISRYMLHFGTLMTMIMGPFLPYNTLNYIIFVFPVTAFFACWWIPESPYYCLKEGNTDAARKVLSRIRGYSNEKELEDELFDMKSQVRNETRRAGSVKELLTSLRYRKAVLLCIGLKIGLILSGQLVIQQYVAFIVKESQANIDLSTLFIVFGGLRFIACVMSSVVIDKVGRRPLLLYTFIGTAVSLAFISVYFFFQEIVKVDKLTLKPYGFVPFASIVLSGIISTLGYASILNFLPAELFPLNVRAVSIMLQAVLGGLLNFSAGRGYQIVKDFAGLTGVFTVYTLSALAGAIVSLYLPETKGKSLKEIQIELQGDMYEDHEEMPNQSAKVDEEKATNSESKELQVLLGQIDEPKTVMHDK